MRPSASVWEIVVRGSTLLAATAAVTAVCASGAAQAAHVGVYVGASPGYYEPAPYQPPPPPQYIQQGPDGQPQVVQGDDTAPPPYPPGNPPQYGPNGSPQYPPDAAPAYPQGAAPQYAPGAAAPPPPDDDDDAPQYSQGTAPQPVTPQASGNTWYYCDATRTYYPYVKDCSSGWRPVPAQPAQQ